jgi:hypothetical protein
MSLDFLLPSSVSFTDLNVYFFIMSEAELYFMYVSLMKDIFFQKELISGSGKQLG